MIRKLSNAFGVCVRVYAVALSRATHLSIFSTFFYRLFLNFLNFFLSFFFKLLLALINVIEIIKGEEIRKRRNPAS